MMLLSVSIPIQISPVWKAFLPDQRPRVLQGVLCSRTLSLRSATDKVRLAQESMDKARFKLEELQRDQKKKAQRENKSREDIKLLLHSAPEEDIRLSLGEKNDETVEDNDDDSDWEDLEKDRSKISHTEEIFSLWCVRYLVSDRVGANGLLESRILVL